ncbi:bifunctional terpene synthase/polyprenyl synthetase family protein [Aspergillus affinis]|uniref:bifunctional terpene synthase/polyprenyl synthetase family protein n=1 Tax=Aspergillus affinis TaxID=1070780 RepID=UPI0022FF2367|nr:putative geranylgeranyl diphosphate synthase [Aspergillus affinis]KAI9040292.1 putative geranylgeranyl diphosphate synthase [Aspergillus affinis]
MEFKFSTVVEPSTYETQGLCDGLTVRYHKNTELEEIDCLRCQEHWREQVGPLGLYKGGLGHPWSGMSIAIPEALPERLGIVSYANELAFLHDDVTDIAKYGDEHNNDLKAAFDQVISTGTINHAGSGKRALQAYVAKRMLSIDKDRAITSLKAWSTFLDKAGRQEDYRFNSEDEYLKYRVHDVGMLFWYGLLTFAQAITIPENELEICHQLATTAYLHMALVNDLVSWDKERQSAVALGKDYVTNFIFVAMEEHGISEDQAQERCRQEIKKATINYLRVFQEIKARDDLSSDTKRYLESVLYSMSGNVVWSFYSPRYYTDASFSERQLEWMNNGIPKAHKPEGGASGLDQSGVKVPDRTVNGDHTVKVNGTGGHDTLNGDGTANENNSWHASVPGRNTNRLTNGGTSLLSAVITQHLSGRDGFRLGDHDIKVESFKHGGHDIEVESPPKRQDLDAKVGDIAASSRHPQFAERKNPIKQVLQAPYEYITALPSKGIREHAIDALNVWFRVPAEKLSIIKSIITILHNASLMLDDLEDGSELRRGKSSTHMIFGLGQTVNSANYQLIRALQEVQKLEDPKSLLVFTEELHYLYVGQSMDLYWTSNLICPSINEYFRMVEHKTGGLVRLFSRLMALHSTNPVKVDIIDFSNRLGRYFQTRDDYQNLVSAEVWALLHVSFPTETPFRLVCLGTDHTDQKQYTKQKGFCEDLEEGKFSLPLIHLFQTIPDNYVLRNVWMQRRVRGTATHAQKETILDLMKRNGSLQFTEDTLEVLYGHMEKGIGEMERKFGTENFQLRLILELLRNG